VASPAELIARTAGLQQATPEVPSTIPARGRKATEPGSHVNGRTERACRAEVGRYSNLSWPGGLADAGIEEWSAGREQPGR
jgi:hypothetical protein